MSTISAVKLQEQQISLQANIAEYAAKYGIPYFAACGMFNMLGYPHIWNHINERKISC